jgi:hypothetical protein
MQHSHIAHVADPTGKPDSDPDFPFKGSLFAKFDIGRLINLQDIQSGFHQVPLDPYVADGSRFKDIVRFEVSEGGIATKGPHGPLVHPINAGTYGGCSSRTYAEIPAADLEPLTVLIEIFKRIAKIDPGQEILAQRQRVMINNDETARTVQEGRHQDGLKKLAIFCIARVNITGGISSLYDSRGNRVFAGTLKPGQILFVDDVMLWHDATAILPSKPGLPSYRDVILLNWPAEREEDHIPEKPDAIAPYHRFYPSC